MISNHLTIINERRSAADALSAQVSQYLAAGGQYTLAESAPINPEPAKRSEKIDPETVLKRKTRCISPAGRKQLRWMTEAL